MIVVIELVFPLSMHALVALLRISPSGCFHCQSMGPLGLNRGERQEPLEIFAGALWARRRYFPPNQYLKGMPAALAGVFVDRYDGTRIIGGIANFDRTVL